MLLICRYAFVVIMEGLWDVPALEMSLARGCCLSGVEECVCVCVGVSSKTAFLFLEGHACLARRPEREL